MISNTYGICDHRWVIQDCHHFESLTSFIEGFGELIVCETPRKISLIIEQCELCKHKKMQLRVWSEIENN